MNLLLPKAPPYDPIEWEKLPLFERAEHSNPRCAGSR